jgi:hypothetical protein
MIILLVFMYIIEMIIDVDVVLYWDFYYVRFTYFLYIVIFMFFLFFYRDYINK